MRRIRGVVCSCALPTARQGRAYAGPDPAKFAILFGKYTRYHCIFRRTMGVTNSCTKFTTYG